MTISTDRRTIRAERADEAIAWVRDQRDAWFESEIALARRFSEIDRKAAFCFEGAACASELASLIGYDGFRVRDLILLGHAIKAEPKIEDSLRAKRTTFAAAFALGRVLPHPEYLRPDDQWLKWAEMSSLKDLRRTVAARITQVRRQVRDLRYWGAMIDDETWMDLDRCQEVASGRAKKLVTGGEMLRDLARHYLGTYDPLEQVAGTRRMGPTSERPFDRRIPRSVLIGIFRRASGLCEVGFCTRPIEEIAHIKPHAAGSGRELRDLFGACHRHHVLYDAKVLRFLEWSADGRPTFVNSRFEPFYPAPRDRREPPEEWLAKFAPEEKAAVDGAEPEPPEAASGSDDGVRDRSDVGWRALVARRGAFTPAPDGYGGASLVRERALSFDCPSRAVPARSRSP